MESSKKDDPNKIRQRNILWFALAINFTMFLVEVNYGLLAHSTSLLADSLDMLGDALVYGVSIYAIGKSNRWIASTSLMKGTIMIIFGAGLLIESIWRYMSPELPVASTMGIISSLAIAANFICAALLLRYRNEDLNMRATWVCTRNDVIANMGVMLAAGGVAITRSKYPDLIVGVIIAILVIKSSFDILKESLKIINSNPSDIYR